MQATKETSSTQSTKDVRANSKNDATIADWAKQQIIFVSGKGGVGKSLVAAGIAHEQAKAGRRVLLAEIGDLSYYQDFFGLSQVGHEPIRTKEGFDLAIWNGESCLREYVLFYLRMQRLYSVFFENKVMKSLINVAPGLNEIAILGKITSGIRKVGPAMNYDLIVVDCYATGHALALLEAPRGMMEAIAFGPMGHHSREMEAVIQNPQLCGYVVATLLEEMPVVETIEFREKLHKSLGVESIVVANKVLPLPVSDEQLKELEAQDPQGLGEFAKYLASIEDRQSGLLKTLKKSVTRLVSVPYFFTANAQELVKKTGEALRDS